MAQTVSPHAVRVTGVFLVTVLQDTVWELPVLLVAYSLKIHSAPLEKVHKAVIWSVVPLYWLIYNFLILKIVNSNKLWLVVSRQLCPQGPEWHYFLKTCYYIEDTKTKTWSEARRACQGFKDTDLAIITDNVEKVACLVSHLTHFELRICCFILF